MIKYNFGNFPQEAVDVLMALDSQYGGSISALYDRIAGQL